MVKARLGGDASAEAWIIMICMGLGWGGESGLRVSRGSL